MRSCVSVSNLLSTDKKKRGQLSRQEEKVCIAVLGLAQLGSRGLAHVEADV